nr:penicillin-binding protein activator LpoB [Treponema sp.]
ERLQQIDNVDPATAAAIANETGADYMFVGRVQSVVQYDNKGKTGTRRYYVTLQMHDLSTTVIVWSGQNDEIKKIVSRPSTKL